MKILVTGGTGFVGAHLLPELKKNGFEILVVTTNSNKNSNLSLQNYNYFEYRIEDHENFIINVKEFKPDVVIHLASYLTASDELSDAKKLLNANINFLINILDALKEVELKWFINTGSFAEYFQGNFSLDPAYFYTATKIASRAFVEYYAKSYEFNYITVAPYTIYGGVDTQKKIIDLIYESLTSSEPVDLTPGNQVLDFIHINDVIDFYLILLKNLEKVTSGVTFHLGTGVGHTLRELVSILEKKAGSKAKINWGGKAYRKRDVMYAVANISLQYRLFGWRPNISLEEGVNRYLEIRAK